ncbi:hypothetical protein KQH27_01005 [bacterium]|nr:hypothetical protein [bacterium]
MQSSLSWFTNSGMLSTDTLICRRKGTAGSNADKKEPFSMIRSYRMSEIAENLS